MINWNSPTPPTAPFIASIFNYYLSDDLDGYEEYDVLTLDLVKTMPGYLGYESMKHNGRGTFISYWKDMEAVQNWAQNPIHIEAKKGRCLVQILPQYDCGGFKVSLVRKKGRTFLLI